MTRSDIIDVEVALHHETERAVLVSPIGTSAEKIWLPKSQVEIDTTGPVAVVTIRQGFAIEKGLV
jgi:hypothetical protein